jgi:hypothetical protein
VQGVSLVAEGEVFGHDVQQGVDDLQERMGSAQATQALSGVWGIRQSEELEVSLKSYTWWVFGTMCSRNDNV